MYDKRTPHCLISTFCGWGRLSHTLLKWLMCGSEDSYFDSASVVGFCGFLRVTKLLFCYVLPQEMNLSKHSEGDQSPTHSAEAPKKSCMVRSKVCLCHSNSHSKYCHSAKFLCL